MGNLIALYPLASFNSKIEPLEFSNGVLLRRLTLEEIRSVFSWFGMPSGISLGFHQYGLQVRQELSFDGLSDADLHRELDSFSSTRVGHVLSAMRLASAGHLYCPVRIAWCEPLEAVSEPRRVPVRTLLAHVTSHYPQYKLDDRSVATVLNLLPRLQTVNRNVQVAVDRLNSACERSTAFDRIVDLCVAAEALFADGGDSLSFKIALRMARYVGTNPFRRRQVYNFMRITYAVRSAVVHGETAEAVRRKLTRGSSRANGPYGFRDIEECARVTEDWIRACVRKAVIQGRPKLEELDLEAAGDGLDDGTPEIDIR